MTGSADLSDIDVVVLAGGLGTRLRAVLGEEMPKILAPLGDETYLDFLAGWLAGFGAQRLVLSLGHLADRVVDHLAKMDRRGIDIVPVIEETPLGTAGALKLVRPEVKSRTALIMNGDSWIGADLAAFVGTFEPSGAVASILCVRVDDAGRYGRIDVDGNGWIVKFAEKQPGAGPGLVNAGIYAFSRHAWDLVENARGPSLERDVFQALAPGTLAAHDAGDVPFVDIGTPESLAAAVGILGHGLINDDGL